TSPVFSPKGWEFSAQGNALGLQPDDFGSLKGCDRAVAALQAAWLFAGEPRAFPWAEDSQPFRLKTASGHPLPPSLRFGGSGGEGGGGGLTPRSDVPSRRNPPP